MKSTDVYKIARDILGPWCKENGFKRTKSGMLGWYRPMGEGYLTFWLQCSQDGWDDYAGSKFVVEFQWAEEPVIGLGHRNRSRLNGLLTDDDRAVAHRLQNDIIRGLPRPPSNHPILGMASNIVDWYRRKFQPHSDPYSDREDLWLRYHSTTDVEAWANFLLDRLPLLVDRFSSRASKS